MEYRRFGKTNKKISVITLGTMRFRHVWDEPRDDLPKDTIDNGIQILKNAFKAGINHIETAYGYTKSEHLLGYLLNDVLKKNRNSYYLMTKGNPKTAGDMRELVEKQLKTLRTDFFEFYAWHGINNQELLEVAIKKGGPVEELHKMKDEGIIKHIGFSTHGNIEHIIGAIESDLFEFVNLHYYYFFQRHYGAIALAQAKDMGVFIISPNHKGGFLFSAPKKLRSLTKPMTPIQWNARFCLQNPAIHTLSFGMTEPEHFDEMMGIFPISIPFNKKDKNILAKIQKQEQKDPSYGFDGYSLQNDPSRINIPEILRMWRMWKYFDILEYGKFRYNLIKEDHHWFQGKKAFPENIKNINMDNVPEIIPLKEILAEAHEMFYKKEEEKEKN